MNTSFLRHLIAIALLVNLASCGNNVDLDQLTPRPAAGDQGTAAENKMIALARGHSGQKRATLTWSPRLAKTARSRANDMARRGYFSHIDPDGHGPNWHVSQSGYRLPLKFNAFKGANQIESILAGEANPEAAFTKWMHSRKHLTHILGRNPFYEKQTRVGVGYAYLPNSKLKHYWVFLSAPPEN